MELTKNKFKISEAPTLQPVIYFTNRHRWIPNIGQRAQLEARYPDPRDMVGDWLALELHDERIRHLTREEYSREKKRLVILGPDPSGADPTVLDTAATELLDPAIVVPPTREEAKS